MSPEQISAHRIRLDRRTDVFSLAVTLYEIVTLRRPFHAETREGVYQAILMKTPEDPRRINPAIPRDLAVVVRKAIDKDRDRRYATALEFAEDLERIRAFEPILARPTPWTLRLYRWSQRNRGVTALLLVLLAVIGVAMAWSTLNARQEVRDAAEKQRERRRDSLAQRIETMVELAENNIFANILSPGVTVAIARDIAELEGRGFRDRHGPPAVKGKGPPNRRCRIAGDVG